MHRLVLTLALLSLLAPAAGARSQGKSWANGVITRVSPAAIAVRGTITLAVPDGANGTKTTLDGMRLLTCDVTKSALVKGYRKGGRVKIICSNGVLLRIARL